MARSEQRDAAANMVRVHIERIESGAGHDAWELHHLHIAVKAIRDGMYDAALMYALKARVEPQQRPEDVQLHVRGLPSAAKLRALLRDAEGQAVQQKWRRVNMD